MEAAQASYAIVLHWKNLSCFFIYMQTKILGLRDDQLGYPTSGKLTEGDKTAGFSLSPVQASARAFDAHAIIPFKVWTYMERERSTGGGRM